MNSVSLFLLGAATAGVSWASLEVLWTIAQPLLPIDTLRGQLLLPPRRLFAFILVALFTYLPLGFLIGTLGLLPCRPLLRRCSGAGAFAVGVFAVIWILGCLGVVVWVGLLSTLPLFSPKSILLLAAASLGVTLVAAFGARTLARLSSVQTGGWLVGVLFPGLLLGAAAGAHRFIEYRPLVEIEDRRDQLPNIILVTLDTLRADHVGVYSQGRVATPVMDQFAREGMRFARAVTAVPHTTPSHVSIFTSNYPFMHGARNGLPMRVGLATLPEQLRRIGYHTAAFAAAYTTKSNVTGLGDAFDVYVDSMNPWIPFLSADEVEPLVIFRLMDRIGGSRVDAPIVNERIRDWLEGAPSEPFLLWAHFFDIHAPYPSLPEYEGLFDPSERDTLAADLALYAPSVSYTDRQLGILMSELRGRGYLEDAIVVIASDHGEGHNEHHPTGWDRRHGTHLYDAALLVPLILWAPTRGIAQGLVVEQQVESIDIAPILLGLLGEEQPGSFRGRSLPRVTQAADPEATYSFSQSSGFTDTTWYAIRSARWKYMVNADDGGELLFDLRADPGENVSVLEQHPDVADRYRERLRTVMTSAGMGASTADLSPDAIRQLRALGYLEEED